MSLARGVRPARRSRARAFSLVLLASTALAAADALTPGTAQAQEGPFVYVSHTNFGNVSRIDIPTDAVVGGTIATGNNPFGIAVRSDQSLVYVANQGASDNIAVIDTATHTVAFTIPVGNDPSEIALSRDNTRLYVANSSSNSVSVIDTATNSVIATIGVGAGASPSGIAVSPDGTRVYVANNLNNTVSVIDTVLHAVLTIVPVGNGPRGIAVSPDGSVVYVANNGTGNNVSVIRTTDNTVVATIPAGNDPRGIVFSPDGTRAYVANQGLNPASVSVIDTATRTVIDTFIVSAAGQYTNIGISPDGSRLYVPDTAGGATVHIVDAATGTLIATVPAAANPLVAAACGNGNALLTAGRTFVAKSAGAIGCTGAGGPVLMGGTMQIAAAGITSTLPMVLGAAGGTIDTQGNTATFSGAITGTGGLTKIGTGTLILSGGNTYSGATNLNQGTLQAGAANTFSPLSAFNVAAGATLNLNSFDQAIGSLAGTGVVNLGAATLTAGGDNSSTTFSGTIGGSGGLTKVGSGALILTGASTYTGPTNVNAGILNVNGTLASTVNVNNGATLMGNGTIGGLVVNGGTLAPGNSIGTITVNGSLVMNAAPVYQVEVSPSAADRTNVTGSATLAGTVQAVFEPGSYVTRNYTILSAAGGLGGTQFGALATTNLPGGFAASLIYAGNDVLLNLTGQLGVGAGFQGNQTNVANALNNFFNNGGALPPQYVTLFGLTGATLGNALTQLSGEVATGIQQAGNLSMGMFLNTMLDPFVTGRNGAFGAAMAYAPEQPSRAQDAFAAALPVKAPPRAADTFGNRWSVWGAAYGGRSRIDGDAAAGSSDTTATAGGFAAGADYRVSPALTLGAAVAIGETRWSTGSLGSGDSNLAQVGGYGSARWNSFYLSGAIAGAWHNTDTQRTLTVVGVDWLEADFDATAFGARIEGGWRHQLASFSVTPYAAVQVQSVHTPAYSERVASGAGTFALSYASQTATDTRTELGLWADTAHGLANGAFVMLRGRAAWVHDFNPDTRINAVFQTLPGSNFTVDGAAGPRNAALTSAAAELRLRRGISLIAKADGEFSDRAVTYAGTGTIRYQW